MTMNSPSGLLQTLPIAVRRPDHLVARSVHKSADILRASHDARDRPRNVPFVGRKRSRGTLVVIQQPAQARSATNRTRPARWCAGDQHIPKPLMIPFEMVVRDVFTYGSLKMTLAQGNDPVEALFFD